MRTNDGGLGLICQGRELKRGGESQKVTVTVALSGENISSVAFAIVVGRSHTAGKILGLGFFDGLYPINFICFPEPPARMRSTAGMSHLGELC